MFGSKYDYLNLGSTPWEEDCVGVNSNTDYMPAMREECRRYKRQLERDFAIPEDVDAYYKIKTFPHDFGSYMEVCIVFNQEDEKTCEFAYDLEDHLPARWEIPA